MYKEENVKNLVYQCPPLEAQRKEMSSDRVGIEGCSGIVFVMKI